MTTDFTRPVRIERIGPGIFRVGLHPGGEDVAAMTLRIPLCDAMVLMGDLMLGLGGDFRDGLAAEHWPPMPSDSKH